jgi:hypothetical protein
MRAACSVLIVGILDDDEQARIETTGVGPVAAVSCPPPPIVDIAVVTSLGPHETCLRLLVLVIGRRRRPTPRGDDDLDRTDG